MEDTIMLSLLKKLFGSKTEETKVEQAPYKVENLIDTSDIAIAQRSQPVAEKATQAVVESIAPAPAKKKPAPKKAPAKTTAKKTPAAKTPRAPKAPKK